MAYIPTSDDFDAADKITNQSESTLQKAGDVADIFNKTVESARLPELSGGLLQGGIRGAESIVNLPLLLASKLSGKDLTIPYVDLQKFTKQDPISRGIFDVGQVAGEILPFSKASSVAEDLASNFMKPSIARTALTGGATGVATSGSEDERSRIIGALTGSTIPALLQLRPISIANKVLEQKSNLKDMFTDRYKNIFNSLKDRGLDQDNITLPSSLKSDSGNEAINDIFTNNRDFQKAVNRFKENPTFENGHQAQSALGKLKARLLYGMNTAQRTGRPISGEEVNRMNAADELQRKIRGNLQQFLVDNKQEDLFNQYSNTTRDFREQMAPYLNPDIAKYEQGKTRAKDLVAALVRNEKFMAPKGGAYQDITGLGTRGAIYRSGMEDVLKKALTGASIASGAGLAAYLGAPYVANKIRNFTS